MAYADLIADVREALGVSSQHDTSILRGIKRSAKLFLRNFNFRQAVRRTQVLGISLGVNELAIPTDAGKIKAVRLRQLVGSTYLYKRLRRREEGQLPRPVAAGDLTITWYWFEPPYVILDTPMPQVGVDAEIWYQSIDVDWAESWLSVEFGDVLMHQSIYELAPMKRKPEVQQLYSSIVQADVQILAQYLQELEFNDLEMQMGSTESARAFERYPAN